MFGFAVTKIDFELIDSG